MADGTLRDVQLLGCSRIGIVDQFPSAAAFLTGISETRQWCVSCETTNTEFLNHLTDQDLKVLGVSLRHRRFWRRDRKDDDDEDEHNTYGCGHCRALGNFDFVRTSIFGQL